MPELPDIEAYLAALRPRVAGQPLGRARVLSPFLVRTVAPPLTALVGAPLVDLARLGKRLVFGFGAAAGEPAGDRLYLVLHLMIAGRLRWLAAGAKPPGRITLALLEFPTGALAITEASSQKRAALHVVRGRAALAALDPGGVEVLTATPAEFAAALRRENHTVKRALTDPRLIAGVGNAYSDEILHAARLSPLTMTSRLTDAEIARLHDTARELLTHWTEKLSREFSATFPGAGGVTAFRPEFAVHGKFGRACPACGAPVQRIRYAENETNYCPGCQTAGRVLADRALSRLLKDDWPRTLDELEQRGLSGA